MKDYIKSIPAATFVLLYLFFCGGLYLISYWEVFKVDAFSFIPIWDIPKAFVYPFALTFAFCIGIQIFNYFFLARIVLALTKKMRRKKLHLNTKPITKRRIIFLQVVNVLYLVILISLFELASSFWDNFMYWGIVAILITPGIFKIVFIISRNVKIGMRPKFFYPILMLVVLLPIFSFMIGKEKSLIIYNNAKIVRINKRVIANITDTTNISSLKFLGFLGDHAIISDIENTRIFVLNNLGKDATGIELRMRRYDKEGVWRFPKADSTQLKY